MAWLVRTATSADDAELRDIGHLWDLSVDPQNERERSYATLLLATRPETAKSEGGAPAVAAYLLGYQVADELELQQLATHPQFLRQGAARALLEHWLNLGRSQGARLVLLEVRRSNHVARALYAEFGFVERRVRRNYYRNPNEDALVLERFV